MLNSESFLFLCCLKTQGLKSNFEVQVEEHTRLGMKQVFLASRSEKLKYSCHASLYIEIEVRIYQPLKQQMRVQSNVPLSSWVTLLCMNHKADDTSPALAESMKCLNTALLYSVKLKRYFRALLISETHPQPCRKKRSEKPWVLLTHCYTEPQNHPSVFRDCSNSVSNLHALWITCSW